MGGLPLAELNHIDRDAFVARLGMVVEGSPWVTEEVAAERPFANLTELHAAFCRALRRADRTHRLAVIRAHPDLGARLESLSDASRTEQEGAGLTTLDPVQRERFRELNEAYRAKFGFPFIFAVKGSAPEALLRSFEERLPNELETETREALGQIERIVGFRLEAMIG